MSKSIYGVVISVLFLTSCKKDCNKPSDFRDAFIGKYQCTENINCYGTCSTCSIVRDTIISINVGATDSTLLVLGREVWLDTNGEYYAYHYGLTMRNDSIISNYMNGGLGCGQYESYVGIKISDTP